MSLPPNSKYRYVAVLDVDCPIEEAGNVKRYLDGRIMQIIDEIKHRDQFAGWWESGIKDRRDHMKNGKVSKPKIAGMKFRTS